MDCVQEEPEAEDATLFEEEKTMTMREDVGRLVRPQIRRLSKLDKEVYAVMFDQRPLSPLHTVNHGLCPGRICKSRTRTRGSANTTVNQASYFDDRKSCPKNIVNEEDDNGAKYVQEKIELKSQFQTLMRENYKIQTDIKNLFNNEQKMLQKNDKQKDNDNNNKTLTTMNFSSFNSRTQTNKKVKSVRISSV